MFGQPRPFLTFISSGPKLSACRSEVQANGVVLIAGHRLPLDRQPSSLRQAGVLALPGFAGISSDIGRGLPIRTCPRPDRAAVHRKDPNRIRIARMKDDRKSDVADLLRHVIADAFPDPPRTIHLVNAAVILLVEPIRHQRMQVHAMWVVTELGIFHGYEIRGASL